MRGPCMSPTRFHCFLRSQAQPCLEDPHDTDQRSAEAVCMCQHQRTVVSAHDSCGYVKEKDTEGVWDVCSFQINRRITDNFAGYDEWRRKGPLWRSVLLGLCLQTCFKLGESQFCEIDRQMSVCLCLSVCSSKAPDIFRHFPSPCRACIGYFERILGQHKSFAQGLFLLQFFWQICFFKNCPWINTFFSKLALAWERQSKDDPSSKAW